MEEGQLLKIQGWFETLDRKIESISEYVQDKVATKQQLENRFQLLLNAITNLHNKVEAYKNQQDEEIRLLKRAIHDIEEELKHLRNN